MPQTDTSPPFKYPQKWWLHHFPELSWGFPKLSWDVAPLPGCHLMTDCLDADTSHCWHCPAQVPWGCGWLCCAHSPPCSSPAVAGVSQISSHCLAAVRCTFNELCLSFVYHTWMWTAACRFSLFWLAFFQTPRWPFPQIRFGDSQLQQNTMFWPKH